MQHTLSCESTILGESNTGNAPDYGCAMREMVNDWRSNWYSQSDSMDLEFPFGEVQVIWD